METVIATIISGFVTLCVCMVNNASQRKEAEQQHNATISLIEYKLDELSKRVDKHNNVVERMYQLEEHRAVVDEQIKVANHRIQDLEEARQ